MDNVWRRRPSQLLLQLKSCINCFIIKLCKYSSLQTKPRDPLYQTKYVIWINARRGKECNFSLNAAYNCRKRLDLHIKFYMSKKAISELWNLIVEFKKKNLNVIGISSGDLLIWRNFEIWSTNICYCLLSSSQNQFNTEKKRAWLVNVFLLDH